MNRELYRYHFKATVPLGEVEESLLLAVLATECLHGRSLVRLDASFCLDATKRSCVVDAATEVGRAIACIFPGFITREFGETAFKVERIAAAAPTLRSMPSRKGHDNDGGQLAVAVALRGREGGATAECSELPSALRASQGGVDKAHVLHGMRVRRLTPVECERLMGFLDGYTAIPGAADGPRYRALGNSMAVPVVRWIGERLVSALGGPFTFVSVCSGIEAVSAAWTPLGCTPLLYVEMDRFARRLLEERWGARMAGKEHPL